MFNKNFYPTPRAVCENMVKDLDLSRAFVLEPSAGKGDLSSFIQGKGATVHCIEIEPELCAILREKSQRVIAQNFLTFKPSRVYDFIIMNPPFDAGAAHLLHAWNIADGATIVCLLNAETVLNPYTQERQKLREIIELHGEIEHLGAAFETGAERGTSVKIAKVTLRKPASQTEKFFNLKALKEQEIGGEYTGTELATRDQVFNQVAALDKAIEAMREMSLAMQKFEYYRKAAELSIGSNEEGIIKQACENKTAYNKAVSFLHSAAWDSFLSSSRFSKYITQSVKRQFEKQKKQQQETDFSEANIMQFLELVMGTKEQIMQQAIDDIFDKLCSFDKGRNKSYWKTNSGYKVNRKIILPLGTNYYRVDEQTSTDLEKALCFITGDDFGQITTINQLQMANMHGGALYENTHETTHFVAIKFYRTTGTVHLTFREEYTWAQFNQIAAKGKNWIGSGS